MAAPDIHSRTHLPGGVDPLPINLPRCHGFYNGSTQTVSGGAELRLDTFSTNDSTIFELDDASDATPSGILIKKLGLYMMMAHVDCSAGSKTCYIQTQPASSYPTLGVEDDPATNAISSPFNFNTDTIDNAIGHLLADVQIINLRRISGAGFLPWRTIIGAAKPASNWTVTYSGLSIIKISDL